MGKNFTAVFVVCLGVAALPLACGGDDDDDGGGGNTGGKGGGSGSGTGGSATGGKGGTNTGGSATGGKGGTNTGGAAPTGGTAGMGGAEGGMGGAEGGMGGAGGDTGGGEVDPANCAAYCAVVSSLNCTNEANCVDYCVGQYEAASDRATCDPLFDARYVCFAGEPATAFECNTTTGNAGYLFYSGNGCDPEDEALTNASCI